MAEQSPARSFLDDLVAERDRYRAALEENYPLLRNGTWYDDHDGAMRRLGRIRKALEGEE